ILCKELYGSSDGSDRRFRKDVREHRSSGVIRFETDRRLTVRVARVDQGVVHRRTLNASEIDAVTRANAGLAIAENVIGEPDARTEVVLVARHRRGGFRKSSSVIRNDFVAGARELR